MTSSVKSFLFSALLLGGAWELIAVGTGSLPELTIFVPKLFSSLYVHPIIKSNSLESGGLWPHALATLARCLASFGVGASLGIGMGLLVSQFPRACKLWLSFLEIWHIVPPLVLIPIAISIYGPNQFSAVCIAAFLTMVITSLYAVRATIEIPRYQKELFSFYRSERSAVYVSVVVFPTVMKSIRGGATVAFSFCLGLIVIIEFLAIPVGLGRVMKFALTYGSIELLLIALLWSVFLVVGFEVILSGFFSRWLRKRYGIKGSGESWFLKLPLG